VVFGAIRDRRLGLLMRASARAAVTVAAVLAVAVACLPETDDGAARLTLADGSTALQWGDGEYGVVLVPGEGESPEGWSALATEIAANRMTVVAVDETGATPARLAAAADWLTGQEIERVAYITSGSLGAEHLASYAAQGAALDQIVLISGVLTDEQLAALGDPPKLFVASEGDADGMAAATHMVEVAAGTWNALLFVPGAGRGALILDGEGSDELIDGVVARLEERR
jgi:hypothetical protein